MSAAENNKLIAEFISSECEFMKGHYVCPNGISTSPKDMRFDSNWNWLMAVVDKIETLGYVVNINGITCKISEVLNEEPIVSFVLGDKTQKIRLVYETCIEFIKWYNEKK